MIALAAAVLAVAASVWFALSFVTAGRIPAGPGGRDRVALPPLQRTERARATARYAGALLVIGAGTTVALRAARRS